jgi:coenzyme F420 hydrogenase subunit beta
MTPSPALARVARGDLCAGCGGCAGLAPGRIEMTMEGPGWLRPRQTATLDPAQEAAIAATCPGLVLEQDRPGHPYWGPVLECRAGHSTDPALRRQASSGGGISALLVHLLETRAVDRVIQVAASGTVPVANEIVLSVTEAEVFAAAGSRYAPSAPLARLEEILEASGVTAFVGKPCDVAALRAIAKRDPRVDAKIPWMLSFLCAGVPSQAGAEAVVAELGVAPEDLAAFRYRGDGWPGYATATRRDGRAERMSYNDSWGDILTRHVQFRCRICPDGVGGAADAVCADAWECDADGYPLFDEREGSSLILSRTQKGEALVRAAMEAGRLAAEPLPVSAIAAMQPGQVARKRNVGGRLAALALLGRPRPSYWGFGLLARAMENGLATNLRNVAGTARRALRGRKGT